MVCAICPPAIHKQNKLNKYFQESVGSGHQQVQGRAPPAAPSSNSRYSSSSSLGSSRNGEDVICSLNLRQMIEQGMKIFQHVSKSTLCSVFSGVKKTTNGDSIDVPSCFRNGSKVFLFARWVGRSPKYFLVGLPHRKWAGWREGGVGDEGRKKRGASGNA